MTQQRDLHEAAARARSLELLAHGLAGYFEQAARGGPIDRRSLAIRLRLLDRLARAWAGVDEGDAFLELVACLDQLTGTRCGSPGLVLARAFGSNFPDVPLPAGEAEQAADAWVHDRRGKWKATLNLCRAAGIAAPRTEGAARQHWSHNRPRPPWARVKR